MPKGYTNKIRVYRNAATKKHDLHSVLARADIYGEDIWARVTKSSGDVFALDDIAELGATEKMVDILVAAKYDLKPGYFVEVKRCKAVDGMIIPVECDVTAGTLAGATTIPVDDTTGLRAGDPVVVEGDTTRNHSIVKSTTETAITLYSDVPLTDAFTTDAVVRSVEFYRVVEDRTPQSTAKHKIVRAIKCLDVGEVS